jgi:NAD dependent epimerase/dehydratase family enzyme
LLTASGTGIYNSSSSVVNETAEQLLLQENDKEEDHPDQLYNHFVETIPKLSSGSEYRQKTCIAIEKFAAAQTAAFHFVVPLRVGIVLSASGGFQQYAELASRLGATRFGSGNQMIPWVHVFDAANNIAKIASSTAFHQNLPSVVPINIVAPNPASNKELLAEYSASRRFLFDGFKKKYFGIALPEGLLKMMLGDSACVVLDSCALSNNPKNVGQLFDQTSALTFKYPKLKQALRSWECNVDSSEC